MQYPQMEVARKLTPIFVPVISEPCELSQFHSPGKGSALKVMLKTKNQDKCSLLVGTQDRVTHFLRLIETVSAFLPFQKKTEPLL